MNNLPVDGRRRRLPRRRQAAPLPRGRLPAAFASSGRSTAPTSSTGPSTTTSSSRTTRRRSASSASPATTPAIRSRRGGRARTRCRPAPTCSARPLTADAPTRLGCHPYRAPTGVNSVDVRRPTRVQQLRVLRVLRLPDRGQGRPDRAAAARAAHRAVRDPARELTSPRSCSTRPASRRAACATSMPTANAHEVAGALRRRRGGAFETPRLLLRSEIGNSSDLVGRYLMYHFQTYRARLFPFRLHAHRGRDRSRT